MRLVKFALSILVTLTFLSISTAGSIDADSAWVVDFNSLETGQIVSSVSVGSGINGDYVNGSISVNGVNPFNAEVNSAMIFDSTCVKKCSGGETVLKSSKSGRTLIVSKDLDSNDPDSAEGLGLALDFDFQNWGVGEAVIDSLEIVGSVNSRSLEPDQLPTIELFSGLPQGLTQKIQIPDFESSGPHSIPIGASGISRMRINVKGPLAIDNIRLAPSCFGQRVTLLGTEAPDNIIGTDSSDVIMSFGGNDSIKGLGGNDYICSGGGSDRVFGNDGNDVILGGALHDRLDGGRGNDLIFGNSGNDTLFGSSGVDELLGNQGNDFIHGGDRDDFLWGGDGNDRLVGSDGDDELFGGNGNDLLRGGANDDILWGEEGADTLFGNEGDDEILGGPSHDALIGGGGEDFMKGEKGNDLLTGGDDDDSLLGGPGIDTLRGDNGDDSLFGGPDDDNLNGGAGVDKCLEGETLALCE